MPTYKLSYFGITGLGEPIRATFALGGITFEDEWVPSGDWDVWKADPASPFFERQMPALEITNDDGSKQHLFQSKAILRYVGKIAQFNGKPLYPADPMEAFYCDEVIEMVEDFRPLAAAMFSNEDWADAEKARVGAALVAPDGKMFPGMKKLDARLGNFAFSAGAAPSIADVYAVTVCFMFQQPTFLQGFPEDTLKPFPNIVALKDRLMGLPPLQAYYKDSANIRAPFEVA